MKYPLRKNTGPTKVNKFCMYCGSVHAKVMSAARICSVCKKKGLRTQYGVDGNGRPIGEIEI